MIKYFKEKPEVKKNDFDTETVELTCDIFRITQEEFFEWQQE